MGLTEIQGIKARAGEPKERKKYVIPKVSEKRKKQIEVQKQVAQLDWEFYREIWLASPHYCRNCGYGLGKSMYNWMFHHILPKRDYPQFRHTPENIALVCLECHSKCETNIDSAPKIKLLTEQTEKLLLGLPFTE